MAPVQSLLGTLIKRSPYYLSVLMKPNNYEELFLINKQWIGTLHFTKKAGRIQDPFQQYISSLITIQDGKTVYEEHMEYFLIPSKDVPVILHPTWKKNNKAIKPAILPPEFFKLLNEKKNCDIMYSSSPR